MHNSSVGAVRGGPARRLFVVAAAAALVVGLSLASRAAAWARFRVGARSTSHEACASGRRHERRTAST